MQLSSILKSGFLLCFVLSSLFEVSSSSSPSFEYPAIISTQGREADRSSAYASLLPTSVNHKTSQSATSNRKQSSSPLSGSAASPSGIPTTTTTDGKHAVPTSYCAPYAGSVCKKHITPATFVYYNLTTVSNPTVKLIEKSSGSNIFSCFLTSCQMQGR